MKIDKISAITKGSIEENIEFIRQKFPHAIVEITDEHGNSKLGVDFEILAQELSDVLVADSQDRYHMAWPDKKSSILMANSKTTSVFRPILDKSSNFYNTENIYIEGDNLEALKLLREPYLNKVKLIYVDPPYNTGNNLIYKNDFSTSEEDYVKTDGSFDLDGNRLVVNTDTNGRFHTDWLNMMYPRLKIARDLLTEDGFIVIAIDNNELANLLKICDEIFGENNRVGIITVVHKPEGRNQEKFFGTSNEFALFYAKNRDNADFNNVVLDSEVAKQYNLSDKKGKYRLQNFIRMTDGKLAYRAVRPNFWYPIYVNIEKNQLSTREEKVDKPVVPIYPITKAGVEMSWKILPASAEELIKQGELEIQVDKDGFVFVMEKIRETQVIKTHWIRKEYNAIQYGTKIVTELLGTKAFDFPKSLYLIEDILKLCTSGEDIILDLFSGSATTAHATMLLNSEDSQKRKYILVQLPEPCEESSDAHKYGFRNICDIGEERIRKSAEKIKQDYGLLADNSLDYGFRVFKVDSSNMNNVFFNPKELTQNLLEDTVDNVKIDRTSLDLLFQIMIECGALLSSKIVKQKINNKTIYVVDENYIVACFDDELDNETIEEIAKMNPIYACFKGSSFNNDSANINAEQIFKTYSPNTEKVKVI